VEQSLPEIIRVKLSSEQATAVSITPVVVRDMPLGELVELMLDLTGKSVPRIQELLRGGSLVVGGSRYRWSGFRPPAAELQALLDRFPDPDPSRPFSASYCFQVFLEGSSLHIWLARETLSRRRLGHSRSFWDELLALANEIGLEYAGYHYREHADRYRLTIPAAFRERLAANARLISSAALQSRVRAEGLSRIVFLVRRPASASSLDPIG